MNIDLATLAPLITGSGGALVVLLAWIYAISKQWMVPGYVHMGSEKRIGVLEDENSNLNEAVIDLSKQNAGMEAKLTFLSQEVETLRVELKRFRKDVGDGSG
jgi:hypothetical protein